MQLPSSDTTIQLPDDGTSWKVQQAESSDFITRIAPAEPTVEMELAYFSDNDCTLLDGFDDRPQDRDAPMFADNVPFGWADGPTLIVESGTQRILCLSGPKGAFIAGLYLPKGKYDIKPYRNMLVAIQDAVLPEE